MDLQGVTETRKWGRWKQFAKDHSGSFSWNSAFLLLLHDAKRCAKQANLSNKMEELCRSVVNRHKWKTRQLLIDRRRQRTMVWVQSTTDPLKVLLHRLGTCIQQNFICRVHTIQHCPEGDLPTFREDLTYKTKFEKNHSHHFAWSSSVANLCKVESIIILEKLFETGYHSGTQTLQRDFEFSYQFTPFINMLSFWNEIARVKKLLLSLMWQRSPNLSSLR